MSYCAVRARQVGPILKLVRSASNATTIRTSVVGPTVEKETHTGQVSEIVGVYRVAMSQYILREWCASITISRCMLLSLSFMIM